MVTSELVTDNTITYADKTMKKTARTKETAAVTIPDKIDEENYKVQKKTITRRKHDTKLGTDVGPYTFKAADRKAWLHVGRVNKNCSENDLLEFLNKKQPHRTFDIQKISSEDSPTTSFRVGLDFDLLEKLNQEQFWPKGIKIKRFRFFRDQGKYNNNRRSQFQYTQY